MAAFFSLDRCNSNSDATDTVSPLQLRQQYGDIVETATLARILLAPVASKLSGDPSNLHRRCVIGRYLDFFLHPEGLRDDLVLFGAIEAVAVSKYMHNINIAVVVFWAETSVAIALQRQPEITSPGWFAAVPRLEAALPVSFPGYLIEAEAELYPPIPATGTPGRSLFLFRNSPHDEQAMAPPRRDPGTSWFTPSERSRIHGPVVGADRLLWMDGFNVLFDGHGTFGFQVDPSWIRVAPLDPPEGGGDDPPTYVPLFSTAATLTCVPQTDPPVPAATAMVDLLNLRDLYGDVVETATIARDILAPVARSQLSGDTSNFHRRCVLGRYLRFYSRPDDVRDDLAPFGAIEAVAVCGKLSMAAVVVFWAEASVAVALGRQGETAYGWYTAVPPLDEALPLRFLPPSIMQVAFYPPTPVTAPPGPLKRFMFDFQNSPHEPVLIPNRGDAGTTWFKPSSTSLLHGPVLGADDHLWMDGDNIIYYEEGVRVEPSWIRVTLLNSPGIYCGDPPLFIPFFSVSTQCEDA